MSDRPPPDLLSADEEAALLKRAERMWRALQDNNLGGFSGGNRPFWILHEMMAVIEQFGRRDVGLQWTRDQLEALKAEVTSGS